MGEKSGWNQKGKVGEVLFILLFQLFDNKYSMFFYNTKWSLLIRKSFPDKLRSVEFSLRHFK